MKILFLLLSVLPYSNCLATKKNTTPIPNIYKRDLMNKILLTSVGTSCGPLLVGYLDMFAPPVSKSTY